MFYSLPFIGFSEISILGLRNFRGPDIYIFSLGRDLTLGRYNWDFSLLGEEAFDFGLICVATAKFSVIDIDLSIFRLLLP